MNASKLGYFPSLYDPSTSTGDIWTMLLSSQDSPDVDEEAWPNTGSLTVAEYQPLEFYCPPVGPAAPWSEGDDACELGIHLKKIELLTLMGEALTAEDMLSACNVDLKLRPK